MGQAEQTTEMDTGQVVAITTTTTIGDLDEKPICRICHCTNEDVDVGSETKSKSASNLSNKHNGIDINDPLFLITPCFCTGTLQYVHHKCLQQWIRSSNHKYCELCKYNFKLKTKNKPLYKVSLCFSWHLFSPS